MILGVGTDLIEIDRIKDAINNTPMFLEKPEQSREPGDGVCIWKSLGYSPTARLRGKGR